MSARSISWYSLAPLLASSVVGGIGLQVFLAGLTIFGGPADWGMHGMFGGMLALPILALGGMGLMPSGAAYRRPALFLALLYVAQVMLVVVGQGLAVSWLAALHPVNALVMLLVAMEAWRRARGRAIALSTPWRPGSRRAA